MGPAGLSDAGAAGDRTSYKREKCPTIAHAKYVDCVFFLCEIIVVVIMIIITTSIKTYIYIIYYKYLVQYFSKLKL